MSSIFVELPLTLGKLRYLRSFRCKWTCAVLGMKNLSYISYFISPKCQFDGFSESGNSEILARVFQLELCSVDLLVVSSL